jgi:hypothetical protein
MLIKQLQPIARRLWSGIKTALVKSLPIIAAVAEMWYLNSRSEYLDRPGIYLLFGNRGSRYVGSATRAVRRRWREHASRLRRNTHHNTPMQVAWDSGERFTGLLLEPLPAGCPLSFVKQRERHWIAMYGDALVNIE